MTRSLLALFVALLPLTAAAQTIYKCVDANGGTVISNSKLEKNCRAITSGPENAMPAPKARPSGAAASPSPAGFPRVQEDTQKARDGDRLAPYRDRVAQHERNIQAIQKELGNLR